MWYIFVFSKQDEERAKRIYLRWAEMQLSALYIFVVSVPIIMVLSIILENPLLPSLILVFGGNLPLTLIMLSRERVFYWEWKRRKDEEEIRVWQAERQRQKEIDDALLRASVERMRKYFEQKQRVKQPSQEDNRVTYHLANLSLPSDCRDITLIKKAYRNFMKRHHPDINKDVNSAKTTRVIVKSYKFLEKKFSN